MTRSISFLYVVTLLSLSYLGGTLLFRFFPIHITERILSIVSPRLVDNDTSPSILVIIFPIIFMVVMMGLAFFSKLAIIAYIGSSFYAVFVGLSSAYLIASKQSLFLYGLWWFPFQCMISFLLLFIVIRVAPPFFIRNHPRKLRRDGAWFFIIMLIVVNIAEVMIYNLVVN